MLKPQIGGYLGGKSNIVGFGGQHSPLLKKGQVHFGRQMVKLEDKIPHGGHL